MKTTLSGSSYIDTGYVFAPYVPLQSSSRNNTITREHFDNISPVTLGEQLTLGTLVKLNGHDGTIGAIVESAEDEHGLTFKVVWALGTGHASCPHHVQRFQAAQKHDAALRKKDVKFKFHQTT